MNKNKSSSNKIKLLVRFLEEIDDPKNHFEINWPLAHRFGRVEFRIFVLIFSTAPAWFSFKGYTKKLFNGAHFFTTIYVRYLVHPVMSVTIDFHMSVNWCRFEYRYFVIIWTFIRPGNRATLGLLCTYFYCCRIVGMVPVIPYPPKNNW